MDALARRPAPLGWRPPCPAGAEGEARDGLAAVRLLVLLISFLSFGNFNPALLGTSDAAAELIQKLAVLGLWVILIATTFLPGVQRRPPLTTGLMLPVLLLGLVVTSITWSNNPSSSIEKSAVLAMTSFGAWRLASALRPDELFRMLTWSLAALVSISLVLVFAVPSVGVLRTWQHSGQWAGIFISKQTLGTVSALLVFLGLLRLIHGDRVLGGLTFLLAVACVLGSGSRGGAVLATAAVACVLVARRSPTLAGLLSLLPVALLALGCTGIVMLIQSGLPHLLLFGQEVNLTERTLIWQYALTAWANRPLLGFGINGLWTDQDYYFLFLRTYGWILDNYHSGYVSILVEYGLAGMALFAAFVLALCRRLARCIKAAPLMPPRDKFGAEAIFGFVILCFTINLTETFFFRGTDFLQVTMVFVLVALFTQPTPASRHARTSFQPISGARPLGGINSIGNPERPAS